jgi:probable HAF family extracellular repeat protein
VAGQLRTANIDGSDALYSNGTATVLGAHAAPTVADSVALGIKDNGTVVGQGITLNLMIYAFIYNNGQLTKLGTFPDSVAGQFAREAFGINDAGQITGPGTKDSSFDVSDDARVYIRLHERHMDRSWFRHRVRH